MCRSPWKLFQAPSTYLYYKKKDIPLERHTLRIELHARDFSFSSSLRRRPVLPSTLWRLLYSFLDGLDGQYERLLLWQMVTILIGILSLLSLIYTYTVHPGLLLVYPVAIRSSTSDVFWPKTVRLLPSRFLSLSLFRTLCHQQYRYSCMDRKKNYIFDYREKTFDLTISYQLSYNFKYNVKIIRNMTFGHS